MTIIGFCVCKIKEKNGKRGKKIVCFVQMFKTDNRLDRIDNEEAETS